MNTENTKTVSPVKTSLRYLASLNIAVACHVFFIVIVFLGTLAQRDNGLYASKKEFFTSWYFLIAGFIPFPGGALVLTLFFINLVAVFLVRLKWRRRNTGLWLMHFGLLMLCVGAAWTYFATHESYLTVVEGDQSSYSDDSASWELALWPVDEVTRRITAISTDELTHGDTLQFTRHQCTVDVQVYYEDSKAYGDGPTGVESPINSQGVRRLKSKPRKEEQAFPGGIFTVKNASGQAKVLLYAGVEGPTTFNLGDLTWQMQLQPQRHKLPATFELIDVERVLYEETEIPKSFSSHLKVHEASGSVHEARISMNNPLQYKGFTFFQSGYRKLPNGQEVTTLAVVENPGRLFPYISSLVIALGLAVHFIVQMVVRRKA